MSAFERLLEQKKLRFNIRRKRTLPLVIVASGMGYMAEKIA